MAASQNREWRPEVVCVRYSTSWIQQGLLSFISSDWVVLLETTYSYFPTTFPGHKAGGRGFFQVNQYKPIIFVLPFLVSNQSILVKDYSKYPALKWLPWIQLYSYCCERSNLIAVNLLVREIQHNTFCSTLCFTLLQYHVRKSYEAQLEKVRTKRPSKASDERTL